MSKGLGRGPRPPGGQDTSHGAGGAGPAELGHSGVQEKLSGEDHKRVLRAMTWARWPDQEPGWPAFLEGGAALCVMHAEADAWLPRALRRPDPLALPPEDPAATAAAATTKGEAQVTAGRTGNGTSCRANW